MSDQQTDAADGTAVRVALWRAMHVEVDPPPNVLHDKIGLRLADPDKHWRSRPLELVEPGGRRFTAAALKQAATSKTPFMSFFTPTDMLALAREAGFKGAEHVSAAILTRRYFGGRTDRLRPLNREELLVATT